MFMVAPLVPEMIRNYGKWHAAIASDPSAAAFWGTAFYLGLARLAVELILIAAIFLILKPRPNMLGFRADRDDAPAKDNTRP
jgi:hypothetical protein